MSALQDASSNPRWNLVADIGGTNARFSAVLEGQLESEHEFHHSVEEYPEFAGLIGGCLQKSPKQRVGIIRRSMPALRLPVLPIPRLLPLLIAIGSSPRRPSSRPWAVSIWL